MNKVEILKENGTFNKRHASVKKQEFLDGGFYDAMDIVQVKYEMLRDGQDPDRSVGAVADDFGFSRTAYYNIREVFKKNGITALIPEKTGPKKPHKLTEVLQDFIEEYADRHPNASAAEIAAAMQNEKGVTVSKRTIERYNAKKKPL
jgi:hypothetical protein